ncbi:MAG: hypothetical protein ACRCXB_23060 [Aeromonadaceae bacterium]
MMKELHAYAPADLIRFMEFVHGAPVELEAYKDEGRNPPCRMIKASFAGGHIVFRVRSPKHKFTVEVSGPVLATNPDLHKFLKEEQKGRWFVDALGLSPALGALRRFSVSPRRAEALKTLLSGVQLLVGELQVNGSTVPLDAMTALENLTGRKLDVSHYADWFYSSTVGQCSAVHLGDSLPLIVYHAGEVFAATGAGLLECPLSSWIIDGGTTLVRATDFDIVATHPFFVRGGRWSAFRHIPASDFKAVCDMIRELPEYQATHAAPATIQ